MAIYHCSVKTVSRSSGRSATAAAAYRSAERIVDDRTGLVHDYRRKSGVVHTQVVVPQGEQVPARPDLWNRAEAAERRKNSVVAREVVVALPAELDADRRRDLVAAFSEHLANRYFVAVDVAIHEPDREGDQRNHHAHLLMTTRRLVNGNLEEKTRELDNRNSGEVVHIREAWATAVNAALEHAKQPARVDHRSNRARKIDHPPTVKLGPVVTQMERRGIRTERGGINRRIMLLREALEKLQLLKEQLMKKIEKMAGTRKPMEPAGFAKNPRITGPKASQPDQDPEPDPDPGSSFTP